MRKQQLQLIYIAEVYVATQILEHGQNPLARSNPVLNVWCKASR